MFRVHLGPFPMHKKNDSNMSTIIYKQLHIEFFCLFLNLDLININIIFKNPPLFIIPSLVLHHTVHMFPIASSRFKTFRPYLYKLLLYFNCHSDFYQNIIIYIEANSTNSYCTQQLQSCQRGIYIGRERYRKERKKDR